MIMADNNENKVLNVPPLRFPEFSGEWEKCKFGDIATGFDYGKKNVTIMDN